MKITKDSHLDHELTVGQLDYIKKKFADRTAFFKETFELPTDLGTVPCALIGPAVGMAPIPEDMVGYMIRNGRKCAARVHKDGPKFQALTVSEDPAASDSPMQYTWRPFPKVPQVRMVTVIAGPHNGDSCVLYTAYGGPLAPRSPGDPDIQSWDELLESREFWAQHALIE